MLQIRHFLCCGQGTMLAMGPLGVALVPLDFVDSAADVVWGRADTQAWLSHIQAERDDVLLLDCVGEQPYLTALGNTQLRMRAAGQVAEQVWIDPIWVWLFNPGGRQTFKATIVDGDEVTRMVLVADRVGAGEIRIGRALDGAEALAPTFVDTMGFLINPDIPDRECRARHEAREEPPESSVHSVPVDLAAVGAQSLAVISNGPVSLCPSSCNPDDEKAPAAPEVSDEQVERAPHGEAPMKDAEQSSGELYIVADAEELPVDTAESAERAGGFDESGTPASSEPAFGEVVESPAVPEAMSVEGLADLGAETDTEAMILCPSPTNLGPAVPVAFLIHGGTVFVEASRDVVIGRDPDVRALTGRLVATVLCVSSLQIEISRSRCAVMMTTPGPWALMGLGSANDIVPRHVDGSFQDVIPIVTVALNNGDLIDVGERTTIEFRVC